MAQGSSGPPPLPLLAPTHSLPSSVQRLNMVIASHTYHLPAAPAVAGKGGTVNVAVGGGEGCARLRALAASCCEPVEL